MADNFTQLKHLQFQLLAVAIADAVIKLNEMAHDTHNTMD